MRNNNKTQNGKNEYGENEKPMDFLTKMSCPQTDPEVFTSSITSTEPMDEEHSDAVPNGLTTLCEE